MPPGTLSVAEVSAALVASVTLCSSCRHATGPKFLLH